MFFKFVRDHYDDITTPAELLSYAMTSKEPDRIPLFNFILGKRQSYKETYVFYQVFDHWNISGS